MTTGRMTTGEWLLPSLRHERERSAPARDSDAGDVRRVRNRGVDPPRRVHAGTADGSAVTLRMNIVRWIAACMACLAAFAPVLAPALELGPIEARSAQHELLDARIPVRDARSSDLEGLTVNLGSPAQFELAGVARLRHLEFLEFVVVAESASDGYIQVRTTEPINEPSLTFLIDADWPSGRTVRGYKLHLMAAAGSAPGTTSPTRRAELVERPSAEPPKVESSRVEPPSVEPSRVELPRVELPRAEPPETSPPPAPPASAATASGAGTSSDTGTSSGAEYGPVRNSETLWSIASRLRPDESVSPQRMMLAILEANPEAFAIMNVNALKAGAILRIPSREEIGPSALDAATAEVKRQHSAWQEYRKSAAARTKPAPPAAPATRDSGAEPVGRVEVVSPRTPTEATGTDGGADVSALRRELALAMEETDTVRRENDELKRRLADVEDQISDLSRLVELKDEEIAALQAELSARPGSMPVQEAEPMTGAADRIGDLNRLVELKNQEIAALRSELSAASTAAPAAPVAGAPTPAVAEPAAPPETEPEPLPFGLGALPVNPVFLVGGAGLLLLLLGVLTLLRRRRTASETKEGVIEASEPQVPEEEELLVELEAVAAGLSEDERDPRAHPSRVGSTVAADEGAGFGSRVVPVADPGPRRSMEERSIEEQSIEAPPMRERPTEEQIAALWRDEDDRTPGRERERGSGAAADELVFDIDALAEDDSAPDAGDDESALDELAAELAQEGSSRSADEARGDSDRSADGADRGTIDSRAPGPAAPAAGADDVSEPSEPSGRAPESRDEARPDALEGSAGTATERSVDREPESGGSDAPGRPKKTTPSADSAVSARAEALVLEDVGDDGVQTRLDLAQVYMEMGDTESARGFLEAVLAEGDDAQREIAREMLSRLA